MANASFGNSIGENQSAWARTTIGRRLAASRLARHLMVLAFRPSKIRRRARSPFQIRTRSKQMKVSKSGAVIVEVHKQPPPPSERLGEVPLFVWRLEPLHYTHHHGVLVVSEGDK
jgi:hypothetical protein